MRTSRSDLIVLTENGGTGKSAYQSYLDTTTDNPVLTEEQWANQIGDINALLDILNGEVL